MRHCLTVVAAAVLLLAVSVTADRDASDLPKDLPNAFEGNRGDEELDRHVRGLNKCSEDEEEEQHIEQIQMSAHKYPVAVWADILKQYGGDDGDDDDDDQDGYQCTSNCTLEGRIIGLRSCLGKWWEKVKIRAGMFKAKAQEIMGDMLNMGCLARPQTEIYME